MRDYDRVTWRWERYQPNGARLRVYEKSPIGYEWCSEGGLFFVLRHNGHEEAGRGLYAAARRVWYAVHCRET